MNDEALTQAITDALEAQPEGLVEREIRQVVLRNTGLRRRPPEIRAALQQNKSLFVGPLADGRWRLKAVIETEEVATAAEPPDLRINFFLCNHRQGHHYTSVSNHLLPVL